MGVIELVTHGDLFFGTEGRRNGSVRIALLGDIRRNKYWLSP